MCFLVCSYPDAEQQYAAVLDVKVDRCGAASVAAAGAHRDLGRVLALQRRFDRAEEEYSAAVRLCTNLLGIEHPNTACALTDLAAVLREQSKFPEAEVAAYKAVESLKAGVGPDDVSTATALYNLAGLTKRLNKWKEAEEYYAEALRIFKAKLGMNVAETADTLYQVCYASPLEHVGELFSRVSTRYVHVYLVLQFSCIPPSCTRVGSSHTLLRHADGLLVPQAQREYQGRECVQ
jgi:tetratricopeptide (TPR) repeat protein